MGRLYAEQVPVAPERYTFALLWSFQMSTTTTTTIRLPDELKARVNAAAERAGTSPHGFMLQAIAEKAAQDEQRRDFEQVVQQRYDKLVTDGRSVPWSEMRRYLTDRAAGVEVRRPSARKLAR